MKYFLVALLATFVVAADATAQVSGGRITGSLQDPQSRAVVGADVKARAGDATYTLHDRSARRVPVPEPPAGPL